MTKQEAIERFVKELSPIPQEWVKIVADAKDANIYAWPMWGTMWFVDQILGEKLMKHAQSTYATIEEAKEAGVSGDPEEYVNDEMAGAYNIKGTAAYIYEIDGEYLIGVHGAGWDFYDGVWDVLYDLCGYEWHKQN